MAMSETAGSFASCGWNEDHRMYKQVVPALARSYRVLTLDWRAATARGDAAVGGKRAGGQWQVAIAGGMTPRWGPGGKELDYIAPDGTLMAAPIPVNKATIEPGRPVSLFRTRIVGGGTVLNAGTNYDIARDGRILIDTVLDDVASPITLIQNWKPPSN
jgi:hypothetical protein